jgi:hypothetical protein
MGTVLADAAVSLASGLLSLLAAWVHERHRRRRMVATVLQLGEGGGYAVFVDHLTTVQIHIGSPQALPPTDLVRDDAQ